MLLCFYRNSQSTRVHDVLVSLPVVEMIGFKVCLFHTSCRGPVSSSFNSPNLSFFSWEEMHFFFLSQCYDEWIQLQKQWMMTVRV